MKFDKYICIDSPHSYLVGEYRGEAEYGSGTAGLLKCTGLIYVDLDTLTRWTALTELLLCTGRRNVSAYY